MRTIRWITGAVAMLAMTVGCGGGGGPSGPDTETRVYVASEGEMLHLFTITARETAEQGGFSCPGSARLVISDGGNLSGSITIDPCEVAEITSATTIPIVDGALQGTSVSFELFQQQALIEGLQEVGCEITAIDEAFAGTSTPTTLNVILDATVSCDSPDLQGVFDITWRMEGVASS